MAAQAVPAAGKYSARFVFLLPNLETSCDALPCIADKRLQFRRGLCIFDEDNPDNHRLQEPQYEF